MDVTLRVDSGPAVPDDLSSLSRIVVAGGPRTGKTTLAKELGSRLGARVRSTDSLIAAHDWSAASDEVGRWLDGDGSWIVEGVAVVRAIRKWLARASGPVPFAVVWLERPVVAQTRAQAAMHKGCETVWAEVRPMLIERGASVLTGA